MRVMTYSRWHGPVALTTMKHLKAFCALTWCLLKPPCPRYSNPPVPDAQTPLSQVLGNYFRARDDLPSCLARDEYCPHGLENPLFSVPMDAELVNFDFPAEATDLFPSIQNDDRMYITLQRLNDPRCAAFFCRGEKGYPLPLLLTIVLLKKEETNSGQVPTVKYKEKFAVYDLADKLTRRLTNAEQRDCMGHGYGQLGALEKMATELKATVKLPVTAESWLCSYLYAEALMLTLSDKFESTHSDWGMADDPPRIHKVCAKIMLTFSSILLNPGPPSVVAPRLLKDAAHFLLHLKAGTFVQEHEEFTEAFPMAVDAWKKLLSSLGEKTSR
jgi:hypothetical protein